MAWKPEVNFKKSAKCRLPDSKSPDYKQQTFSSTTSMFSWATYVNILLVWFLDVNLHSKCNMITKMDRNIYSENTVRKKRLTWIKAE